MSDFTDDDVQRGAEAIADYVGEERFGYEPHARVVLAAVLPEYAKRVRAEALRDAADDLDMAVWQCWGDRAKAVSLVRARADAEATANPAGAEFYRRARADAGDPS